MATKRAFLAHLFVTSAASPTDPYDCRLCTKALLWKAKCSLLYLDLIHSFVQGALLSKWQAVKQSVEAETATRELSNEDKARKKEEQINEWQRQQLQS